MRVTTILSLFVFATVVTALPAKLAFKKSETPHPDILHTTHGVNPGLAPSDNADFKPYFGPYLTNLSTEYATGTSSTSSTLSPAARLAVITTTSIIGSLILLALIIYLYFQRVRSPRARVPVEDPLPNPPLSPTSIRVVGVSVVPEAVEDSHSLTDVRSPWSPINPGFPEIGLVDFSRSEVQPGTRVDASQTHLPIAERDESGFFSTSSPRLQNTDDMSS